LIFDLTFHASLLTNKLPGSFLPRNAVALSTVFLIGGEFIE